MINSNTPMKEYLHAFITAAALFYSAEKAGRAMQSMTNDYGGAFVYYLITAIGIGMILRGLYVMLPYPLLGLERIDFDNANPDAYLMTRSQRVLLYKQWRHNKAKQDTPEQSKSNADENIEKKL